MTKKKYPHTYVVYHPPGIADIYFRKDNDEKCVALQIGTDIIDPILEKYANGVNLWEIIDTNALCNCISTEFSSIPNNQKDMLIAYIGVDGKLYKFPGQCSIESKWIETELPDTPKPYRIKGINSKKKVEDYITNLNDKLDRAKNNIKFQIKTLLSTLITEDDVQNFND